MEPLAAETSDNRPDLAAMSHDGFQTLQDTVDRALSTIDRLRRAVESLEAERAALQEDVAQLRARLREGELQLDRMQVLENERTEIQGRLERILESLEGVGLGERG